MVKNKYIGDALNIGGKLTCKMKIEDLHKLIFSC